MKTALFLIALGFGYKVFAEATANGKKSLRQIGRLIGAFTMIVSLLGTFYSIWFALQYYPMPVDKSSGTWGKMCPFIPQSTTQK